jgi:hypothetical protein
MKIQMKTYKSAFFDVCCCKLVYEQMSKPFSSSGDISVAVNQFLLW